MKMLTENQKHALQILLMGVNLCNEEALENDQFNDMLAETGWFGKDLETIIHGILDRVSWLEKDGLTITDPTMDETGRFPVGPDYYKGSPE